MGLERRVLDRHVRHWQEQDLVSAELGERLLAASDELVRRAAGAIVRGALAVLGGGLLLAGLVLIVAENWAALHRGVKLGGWAAIHCGLVAGAVWLARRFPGRPYLAEAFALVSGGWILAGIGLVSQIYHLTSRPPNGLWLWLVLVLPLARVLPRQAVSTVAFAALTSALTAEVAERGSWVHASHAEGPWLLLAIPLLAATAASLLPRPWRALRGWLGAWVFLAGQFSLLVVGAAQQFDRSDLGRAWWLAAPGVLLGLVLADRLLPESWGAGTSRLVLVATLLPWVVLGARYTPGVLLDELAIGVAWVAQLLIAVLVIRAGARAGSGAWVNLGYLALLVGVLTRYFDFFGAYLEGGAALALTGGLMLFILLALEKARRRTLLQEVSP